MLPHRYESSFGAHHPSRLATVRTDSNAVRQPKTQRIGSRASTPQNWWVQSCSSQSLTDEPFLPLPNWTRPSDFGGRTARRRSSSSLCASGTSKASASAAMLSQISSTSCRRSGRLGQSIPRTPWGWCSCLSVYSTRPRRETVCRPPRRSPRLLEEVAESSVHRVRIHVRKPLQNHPKSTRSPKPCYRGSRLFSAACRKQRSS